jgi:hypothetical protein
MWLSVHDFREFEEVPETADEVAAAQELRLDNVEHDDVSELL